MRKNSASAAGPLEIYKQLLPFVRPYRVRLAVGTLCGMLHGGAVFGMLVVLRWALGGISGEEIDFMGRRPLPVQPEGFSGEIDLYRVALLPLWVLVQGMLSFSGKYLVEWAGSRTITDLRTQLFEHIHALPIQFFSQSRVGELITRITSDTGLLMQLVTNVIGDMIREPFTLLGCIAAMIYLDWRLSIIALVFFPVCLLPIVLLGRRVRSASKSGQESVGDMLSVAQESIAGVLVVKAFQMETEEVRRFRAFNMKSFKAGMKQLRAQALSEPIIHLLSSIGIAGVVIYAYVTDISLALLVTFAGASVQMYKPFKKLNQIHMRIQRAVPGAERVFEILNTASAIKDAPDAIAFSGPVEQIVFNHVSFSYDQKRVLDDISLKVDTGQCWAFVGSSGAGKTTLVNLIPRFFDVSEGWISINGRDIRDYTVHSLREHIGVVTQETMLFNQSVAGNISYGSPNATPRQIVEAARRANAHEFIEEMNEGYDTVIGERGSFLSGGMAQRVAIARALLKNPPILILDEATSALDTEAERLVQEAVNELMKGRTVFVIAHRLSTIVQADMIVVLNQGVIVEQGTHDELLSRGGRYKYLYDIQFKDSIA